jgi:hypothetical protein
MLTAIAAALAIIRNLRILILLCCPNLLRRLVVPDPS